jgi:hypothetical protein
VRTERWKLVELPDADDGEARRALYDLRADPDERQNLLDSSLSAEAQAALDELTTALSA